MGALRLLIVSKWYWPEHFSAGVWIHEMARYLVGIGHQVTVLTTFPNHPEGVVHPAYRGRLFQRERHEGVNIVRLWTHVVPRTHPVWLRGLSWLTSALNSLPGSLAVGNVNLVMGFSALPMSLADFLIARSRQAKYLVNVQDIFPDAVASSGAVRSKALLHCLGALDRFVYRQADHIVVISEMFRRRLLARGVRADKLTVIPDWADADFITPRSRYSPFRQKLALRDEFIVLYSGNMGFACDLDTMLGAAVLLRDDPGIQFVMVGDGVKKEPAEARARALGLTNIRFLPLQPREEFPDALAAADICTVTLAKDHTQSSVPGKTYSFMAAGRPILAVMEPANDVHALVEQEHLGACVRPGDAEGLAAAIRRLRMESDQAQACGRRARQVFEDRYTIEACVGQYERLMRRMLRSGG